MARARASACESIASMQRSACRATCSRPRSRSGRVSWSGSTRRCTRKTRSTWRLPSTRTSNSSTRSIVSYSPCSAGLAARRSPSETRISKSRSFDRPLCDGELREGNAEHDNPGECPAVDLEGVAPRGRHPHKDGPPVQASDLKSGATGSELHRSKRKTPRRHREAEFAFPINARAANQERTPKAFLPNERGLIDGPARTSGDAVFGWGKQHNPGDDVCGVDRAGAVSA